MCEANAKTNFDIPLGDVAKKVVAAAVQKRRDSRQSTDRVKDMDLALAAVLKLDMIEPMSGPDVGRPQGKGGVFCFAADQATASRVDGILGYARVHFQEFRDYLDARGLFARGPGGRMYWVHTHVSSDGITSAQIDEIIANLKEEQAKSGESVLPEEEAAEQRENEEGAVEAVEKEEAMEEAEPAF